jgi:hypothetical protein
VKLAGLSALAAAIVLTVGATGANGDVKLRGFGTAEIDGVLTLNEWEGAGRFSFQVDTSPAEGGGTVPATFYVMNDSTNLYLALRVSVASLGNSVLDGIFLAPPPNLFGEGSDILHVTPGAFEDLHFHLVSPNYWDWLADTADGGTRDGASAARAAGGEVVFEVAHPLNSADDLHDFSLTIPSHIAFTGVFQYCIGSCAASYIPASTGGQIVVVSGTRVPPDTRFTSGPADGAEFPNYGQQFGFVGMDDVAPPSEITYECKIDARDWTECESPLGPVSTEDGWHTLSVRAFDEMLNVDPTPVHRRWRIDTQSPSKPKVVVLRRRGAAATKFRLSATDRGTPARRLRFRCAVDAWRFHACASRYRLRLPSGRHVLRVYAFDPAGNGSDLKIVRFVVR